MPNRPAQGQVHIGGGAFVVPAHNPLGYVQTTGANTWYTDSAMSNGLNWSSVPSNSASYTASAVTGNTP